MTIMSACPSVIFFISAKQVYVWHNTTLSSCPGKVTDMEDPARAVEKLVDQKVMEVVSDKEELIYIVSPVLQ